METALAVPLGGSATLGADPTPPLLLKPGVKTYLSLALDVLEYLSVVTHAIVVEIGDLLAGKLLTLVAMAQPLVTGTNRERTDAALGSYCL
jgi:hypothetical protein